MYGIGALSNLGQFGRIDKLPTIPFSYYTSVMKPLQFSTSINCGSCVRAVTPTLDELVGKGNWQVDTENSDKILSITQDNVDTNQVKDALNALGYLANPLQETA